MLRLAFKVFSRKRTRIGHFMSLKIVVMIEPLNMCPELRTQES